MSRRSELRQQLADKVGWICEFPDCQQPWQELSHLVSVGMGGRKSADREDNCCLFCWDHARLSDQDSGRRGRDWYITELARVGAKPSDGAWSIAQAIKTWTVDRRTR